MARFYRRRRSYRRVRPAKRMRYSAECSLINANLTSETPMMAIPIAPTGSLSVSALGMRKAKNFTLTLAAPVENPLGLVAFALVYWPELYSTAPQNFAPTISNLPGVGQAVSMYEPNQNVIMQGVWSLGESSYRQFSSLARNLNSGDTLMLILKSLGTLPETGLPVVGSVKFAIGYN